MAGSVTAADAGGGGNVNLDDLSPADRKKMEDGLAMMMMPDMMEMIQESQEDLDEEEEGE